MGDKKNQTGGKSQATQLVSLANKAELFHTTEGDAFATMIINGHQETWPIKSKGFRRWLTGKFWKAYSRAPGSQAIQDALGVLASKAVYDGPEKIVRVRLAEHDGAIWLDLGNRDWQAVKITKSDWRVVDKPPVKFLRPRGLLPLPQPVPGGSVNLLKQYLNLSCDEDWALVACWMVATFRPTGPYPVLVVNGEQGSAKSTLCRLLRSIIDPNSALLRAIPRDIRDLVITASNSWIMAYDNFSHIAPWFSDALCRLATGGGFATRELYTDREEVIFDVTRPVMINGIEELATRSDLLDRSICLTMPTIRDSERKTEKELWHELELLRPQILGAFLDTVSKTMGKLPTVKLQTPPRMADFATWSVAAEQGLGLAPGTFIYAYRDNRQAANDLTIEVSPIGPAIQDLMSDQTQWEGTAQELLTILEEQHCSEQTKNRRDWPKSPQTVGKALRRLAPNIRRADIDIQFKRGTGKRRKRLIHLERIDNLTSEMSTPSNTSLGRVKTNTVSDKSDVSDNKNQSNSCCDNNLVDEVSSDD